MYIDGLSNIAGTSVGSAPLANEKLIAVPGNVSVGKVYKFSPHTSFSLKRIIMSLSVAPTGADLVASVFKNGSLLCELTISQGNTETELTFTDSNFTITDIISFEVTQIGSTLSGKNLCFQLDYVNN